MIKESSRILGFPVARATMGQCVAEVLHLIAKGRGQVVTANAEILYAAIHAPRLAAVLRGAELITADGMGVVLASRLLGVPVPERVTGIDLTHALAAECAKSGLSWYLLGAAPGVAATAGLRLQEMYPGLHIAGSYHGYFGDEETPEVLKRITVANPDMLLVAMGLRQEFWITDNKENLPCPAMGVGGSFDILAGVAVRAPAWMQRLGLEWSHRLYREPRRLKRMLALPRFVGAVIMERLRN